MRIVGCILYPFDMGLELDLSGEAAGALVAELADVSSHRVTFDGVELGPGKLSGRIYRFGVGLIELRFEANLTFGDCARISCFTSRLQVDQQPLGEAAETLAREIMSRARPFATYTYDLRLEEREPLSGVRAGRVTARAPRSTDRTAAPGAGGDRRRRGRLRSPVSVRARARAARQSRLPGERAHPRLAIRGGAGHPEARTVVDLLGLVLAQQWSLRSYDVVLDHELDQAQRQLSDLPPYFHFWRMPGRYRDFSREAIAFAQDKLTITASMHSVFADAPLVEADWHMRALYEHARASFRVDALVRRVETKLDRVEAAYNSARELLSTNFSILLDMIFLVFLIWSVLDTVLLALVAFR